MAKKETPGTQSGTAAGTGKKSSGVDLAALVAAAQAAGLGGDATSKGPVFTQQEAAAYVQSVYQQLLGRNAVGAEYTKGVNIFLNQSKDTSTTGRQAALVEAVEGTAEYRKRQENKYLDAIYSAVMEDVRKAQG
jgi:hypothetical protein